MSKVPIYYQKRKELNQEQSTLIDELREGVLGITSTVASQQNSIGPLTTSVSGQKSTVDAQLVSATSHASRLTEIEEDITNLDSYAKPDLYNAVLYNVNLLNTDTNDSGLVQLIDLQNYLSVQGGDTFGASLINNTISTSQKYYIEVTGEFVSTGAIEASINSSSSPVRLYKYTRSESPEDTQTAGLTSGTTPANKEKFGITYGSVTLSANRNIHYFRSQNDSVSGTDTENMGAKFKYIATFQSDSTLRTTAAGDATQIVYVIRLASRANVRVHNVQVILVKLG